MLERVIAVCVDTSTRKEILVQFQLNLFSLKFALIIMVIGEQIFIFSKIILNIFKII